MPTAITPERIVDVVADYFVVEPRDVLGHERNAELVHPRHVAMYLCRCYTSYSFPGIAAAFGGRHHSSVMHAVARIRRLLDSTSAWDPVATITRKHVSELCAVIEGVS